jgi:hypothetical protein
MSVAAVRNNNPGNIRQGITWQGLMPRDQMSPAQAAETRFCVFQSPVWGFRAMATIFHTYADKDGVTTLRKAVARWAPRNENDTGAYEKDVCARLGRQPEDPFNFHDPAALAECIKAFSIHEVGSWAFNDADLHAGVASAH